MAFNAIRKLISGKILKRGDDVPSKIDGFPIGIAAVMEVTTLMFWLASVVMLGLFSVALYWSAGRVGLI